MNITLPYDGNRSFHITKLLAHLKSQRRSGIIIGQQRVNLVDHTKENSLDYWIRANIAKKQNTVQATSEVIDQMCGPRLFERDRILCVDTNIRCNGIVLEPSFAQFVNQYGEVHMESFRTCLADTTPDEVWSGSKVSEWWSWVSDRLEHQDIGVDLSHSIFSKPLSRSSLKEMCKNEAISDATCTAAILAWGGQHRAHGVTTFEQFERIQPIVSKLRNREITPEKAYSDFHDLWACKKISGLGAAYYTKLIFFAEPSHAGYIMDQWTSKSVNLICGERFIQLTADGHVTVNNNADTYQRFCSIVERIGLLIGKSGEEVEMGMFSGGGRNPLCWRKYVKENY